MPFGDAGWFTVCIFLRRKFDKKFIISGEEDEEIESWGREI